MANEDTNAPQPWTPPDSDMDFVFEDPDSLPEWIDPGMRSYSNGPALALPAGDLYGEGPWHSTTAEVGDKVLFLAATPSKPAHFEVVKREPTGDAAQVRPAAQTNASLEDMLKTGWLTPDELSPSARSQVLVRSPNMRRLIEGGSGLPEPVTVSETIKAA